MLPFDQYPRPLLERREWLNLNGTWQYAITASSDTPSAYDGDILVPFSPEAPMSGVNRQLQPGEVLHYFRTFTAPAGEDGHVLLHFGAVDYACEVYVNGRFAGRHAGGYLPFTFDVTNLLLPGENTLALAVSDPSDTGHQARGKQKLERGGMYYTAQSGIWQTVWMERVPESYISAIRVTPDFAAKTAHIRVEMGAGSAKGVRLTVLAQGKAVAVCETDAQGEAVADLSASFFPWSPDAPFLYDVIAEHPQDDRIKSYFAMRVFSRERDTKGLWRFTLNGKPILLNGLLDQGYWPEGLYTAPSEEAMIRDIKTMKDMGFNLLRKHIKIEPQRWYYHCDRLGMIVWQDMVNGGGKYADWFVTYAINIAPALIRRFPDWPLSRKLLARTDAAERETYFAELEAMVRLLGDHPCIGGWVPFNEGWGQFDAKKATALIRRLDAQNRPIDEASGWFDQGGGDMYSVHNYFYPLRVKAKRDRVYALTEFGGIAWPCPGHCSDEKVYGYGTAKSQQELTERYKKLMLETVKPQLKSGLSALVYTQVSDVEDEVNGLLTYDREVTKIAIEDVKKINDALYEEFERMRL